MLKAPAAGWRLFKHRLQITRSYSCVCAYVCVKCNTYLFCSDIYCSSSTCAERDICLYEILEHFGKRNLTSQSAQYRHETTVHNQHTYEWLCVCVRRRVKPGGTCSWKKHSRLGDIVAGNEISHTTKCITHPAEGSRAAQTAGSISILVTGLPATHVPHSQGNVEQHFRDRNAFG